MQRESARSDEYQQSCHDVEYGEELSFDPKAESYCTTGEFARLDGGKYHRHCGPTAVTNLIRTLLIEKAIRDKKKIQADQAAEAEDPDRIFRQVARTGRKYLAYWNTDLFGHFGGTSDFLVPLYLRRCLDENGLDRIRLRGPFPAVRRAMGKALREGAILYLELHFHPKYGNHHLLVYGYARDSRGRLCWKTADGWRQAPVYLPAEEIRFGMFMAIR